MQIFTLSKHGMIMASTALKATHACCAVLCRSEVARMALLSSLNSLA